MYKIKTFEPPKGGRGHLALELVVDELDGTVLRHLDRVLGVACRGTSLIRNCTPPETVVGP